MKRHSIKYYSKGTLHPGAEGFGRHNSKHVVASEPEVSPDPETDAGSGESIGIGFCLLFLLILALLAFIQFLKLIL